MCASHIGCEVSETCVGVQKQLGYVDDVAARCHVIVVVAKNNNNQQTPKGVQKWVWRLENDWDVSTMWQPGATSSLS